MLFIGIEDFYEKVGGIERISREEEKELAAKMRNGDGEAREKLIRAYLPFVAAHIRRAPEPIRTLNTVYECIASLEKAVESFNFLQDSEPFTHRLAWCMRQSITKCIANK